MPKKSDQLKTNFSVDRKIESFYNGGPIQATKCGRFLFTNFGNRVNCIDIRTGTIKCTIGEEDTLDNEVTAFVLSPNDEFLIVAYRNLLLIKYGLKPDSNSNPDSSFSYSVSVERTWKSGHRSPVACLAMHDNARLLASGSSDSTVKIWDLEAQYCTHTLKDTSGCITCVQFAPETWNLKFDHHNRPSAEEGDHPQHCYVFCGDDTGKVHGRDLMKSTTTATGVSHGQDLNAASFVTLSNHTSSVTSILFDSHFLYTCGRDAVIAKYDKKERFALKKMIPTFESIECMVIFDHCPPSSGHHDVHLLTGGESGNLKVWSVKSAKCLKTVKISDGPVNNVIQCESTRSYLASTFDQMIITLTYTDLRIEGKLIGRNDEIYDASFCRPNDSHVVVATNSHDLRVYDVITSTCSLLIGHRAAVLSLDVAQWDRAVLASCSKDNCVLIWRLSDDNGHLIYKATGHANSVTAVKFSRLKSTFLASISDDRTLKIWRLPQKMDIDDENDQKMLTAVSTAVAHDKDVGALDISPNDRFVATGGMDKTVKIWSIDEKLRLTMVGVIKDHKRGVFDVKFSPVDQVIATASGDFTVKIFALEDFNCLKTFEGHQATVLRVRFLANGAQLVSADSAGLLKLWTIRSQECVKTIDAHSDKIYALDTNPAGDRLVTGGSDARVFIWRDETLTERESHERQRREKIENEQTLSNLLAKKRYSQALRLALRLTRQFDAFKIVKNLLQDDYGGDETSSSTALHMLESTLKSFRPDQLHVLLTFAVEWNTNSRNFLVAQTVLNACLRILPPEELLKMPKIDEIVESLTPYTERHFERLTRLRQQSYFVDYTWTCMRITGKPMDNHPQENHVIKREIEM